MEAQQLHQRTFVFEIVITLWRLRRHAPAESNLVNIQMLRMNPVFSIEFEFVIPSALHALAVVALQANDDALNQIARQGRRLLSQYEKLTRQLLTMRQLFPLVTPEPPSHQPQNEPVETNLTEARKPLTNRPKMKRLKQSLLEQVLKRAC